MRKHFSQWFVITLVLIALIFVINTKYIYAAELKEDAESYRDQGHKVQQIGEIDQAISWYQKAASLDPNYAAPHNDLGILFETKGWLDRAEVEYQKAISIDGNYAKAHTNLALLYERKGELEKAAFHWMRRYKLGTPQDPWTQEARQRLEKIGLLEKKDTRKTPAAKPPSKIEEDVSRKKSEFVTPPAKETKKRKTERPARVKKTKELSEEWTLLGEKPKKVSRGRPRQKQAPKSKESDIDRELRESLRLAEERLRQEQGRNVPPMAERKETVERKPRSDPGSQSYYVKANSYFEKGEYSRALDTIRSAKREHPDDADLLNLEESIKNKMKEERIKDHYNEGLMRYRDNNFSGARKEFEAILNILPE
ncbi:MAG: tetratricopeptide repeat protein [Candidatus Omnitrophica bacterium]|nr:tetratricopeptide repeat protein [Candidatus Omnitrophota bacterium]MBU1933316.1 tetratricopeptide repeat protein [Candidatus Omnitrophota bacterium]